MKVICEITQGDCDYGKYHRAAALACASHYAVQKLLAIGYLAWIGTDSIFICLNDKDLTIVEVVQMPEVMSAFETRSLMNMELIPCSFEIDLPEKYLNEKTKQSAIESRPGTSA